MKKTSTFNPNDFATPVDLSNPKYNAIGVHLQNQYQKSEDKFILKQAGFLPINYLIEREINFIKLNRSKRKQGLEYLGL